MKKITLITGLLYFIIAFCIPDCVFAGTPVLTFTPLTPTAIQIPSSNIATVQYTVQNQSSKTHTLMLETMTGITQTTSTGNCSNPFTLAAKQSCTLTLQVSGQTAGNVYGGPIVCQQGPDGKPNPSFCYRPSMPDILNITAIPVTNTFYVGTQNGSIYYSFNNGLTWSASSVTPGAGSSVNSVFATPNILYAGFANGSIYYSANNGYSWNNTHSPDGSAVNNVFATASTLYAGTANGNVSYSNDNGNTWINTSQPDGSAVNSIFATASTLYAGTANGNVYYSTNNGVSWTAINGQPDGSAVMSIFVVNNTLYVNTANEYAYSSTSLSGGGIWTSFAQTVFSLFVHASNAIYAGTQSGYVFSLTAGTELGFVTYSPINSIYVL